MNTNQNKNQSAHCENNSKLAAFPPYHQFNSDYIKKCPPKFKTIVSPNGICYNVINDRDDYYKLHMQLSDKKTNMCLLEYT